MVLKEILEKIIEGGSSVLLSDSKSKDWEAEALIEALSETMLKRQAYFQPGLYIAEISDSGYLGHVLYRLKQKG